MEQKFELHKKIVFLNAVIILCFGLPLALVFGDSELTRALIFNAFTFVFIFNLGIALGLLYAIEIERARRMNETFEDCEDEEICENYGKDCNRCTRAWYYEEASDWFSEIEEEK